MDRQMNIALRKTLDQIGVKHSLKGYGYIISAVEKCLENRSKLVGIIKGLYTEIAEEIVEDCNFSADESDTDDGITYITYDCSGTERYMDSK